MGIIYSLASLSGCSQILSHSRGEKLGEGFGSLLRHRLEMVDSVSINRASPPFPVHDIVLIPGLLQIFLHGCEIKSGSGLMNEAIYSLLHKNIVRMADIFSRSDVKGWNVLVCAWFY